LKTVVISGASNGIGLACALEFAKNGWRVYDLSRRGVSHDGILHLTADVTDAKAVETALAQIDHIDVLIVNAGFGISGAIEFTDSTAVEKQLAVNFIGAHNCVKAAIPKLRESGGHILFTSSVAGILSIPFQSFYSAGKAAVNSYACALANELKPFGIKVCALMLGDAKTGFTEKREKAPIENALYGEIIAKSVAQMEHDEQNGMAPEAIAKVFYKTALQKHPKPLKVVGFQYKAFAVLQKFLPIRLVNWLLGRMYASRNFSQVIHKHMI